jgi:SPP1 family predicted phage head-tail adaptor
MRAGELRHRITIQQQVKGRDTDGGVIVIWSDLTTIWAAVEPLSGAERQVENSDQLLATRLTRFRIRKRNGLDTTMRIVFGYQAFDIQEIIHVQARSREIQLIGLERNPE